jgi:hypothetical protein
MSSIFMILCEYNYWSKKFFRSLINLKAILMIKNPFYIEFFFDWKKDIKLIIQKYLIINCTL